MSVLSKSLKFLVKSQLSPCPLNGMGVVFGPPPLDAGAVLLFCFRIIFWAKLILGKKIQKVELSVFWFL